MASPLQPTVIWTTTKTRVELEYGRINVRVDEPGVIYDAEADLLYRSLLAARRARRAGRLDLPK